MLHKERQGLVQNNIFIVYWFVCFVFTRLGKAEPVCDFNIPMDLTLNEIRKCYSKVLKKLFQSNDNGYKLETVRQLWKISFSKVAADRESYSRNFGDMRVISNAHS